MRVLTAFVVLLLGWPAPAAASPERVWPAPLPEPTYERTEPPSGLVARMPGGDVQLPADTSCWTTPDRCLRALIMIGTNPLVDVGTGAAVDLWFARPGWAFQASLTEADVDCPRHSIAAVRRVGGQWFRLLPAGRAGTYEVDLFGSGPEGFVSTRFRWTTTESGPVDRPTGSIAIFPLSRGADTFGFEVRVDDLAFEPAPGEVSPVTVRTTAADGTRRTLHSRPVRGFLRCQRVSPLGSFYFQREWAQDASVLGPRPLDLEVSLAVRGTTYVGRATWRGQDRRAPYTELRFTPPLP